MADITQQGLYQEGNSIFDDIFALGDIEVQNVNVIGIITASTFSGVDATSLKDTGGTVKIQATTTGATHSGRAVFNEVELQGKVYDSDGDFGTSGQVLSSDGTDVEWVNAGSLAAGAAAQVGINAVSDNSSHFITFSSASSGNNTLKVDTDLYYNPSTNDFYNFSGNNMVHLAGDGAVEICRATGDAYIDFKNVSTEDFDVRLQQVGTTNTIQVVGNLRLNGQLQDGDNNFGSSGQVLSSDGTDTKWINAGSLSAGAAAQVSVTATTSGSQFITFVEQSSGNEEVRVNTGLTYNAATNVLSATSFSGNLTGNVTATNVSGTLQTAAQTNITSVGTLTGLTVDGNLILDSTSNYLHVKGALYDKDGQSGSAGQVLISTGTQIDWASTSSLTSGNSQKITIAESDSNSDFPITFSAAPGQSGGNDLLSDNQFTYNAFSNTVTAGTFSGSGASLTSINASNIGSGTLNSARFPSSISANTSGNAATATKLATARTISGASFDGTANITLNNANITNGAGYVTSAGAVPSGVIVLWSGAQNAIPSGWYLCDGNNGTPDLRSRFVIGAGSGGLYSVGDTGGSRDATLVSHSHTINNHTHPFSGSNSHRHGYAFGTAQGTPIGNNYNSSGITNVTDRGGITEQQQSGSPQYPNHHGYTAETGQTTISISGDTGNPSNTGTNSQGSSATNANLPPYYALCYIMKS